MGMSSGILNSRPEVTLVLVALRSQNIQDVISRMSIKLLHVHPLKVILVRKDRLSSALCLLVYIPALTFCHLPGSGNCRWQS